MNTLKINITKIINAHKAAEEINGKIEYENKRIKGKQEYINSLTDQHKIDSENGQIKRIENIVAELENKKAEAIKAYNSEINKANSLINAFCPENARAKERQLEIYDFINAVEKFEKEFYNYTKKVKEGAKMVIFAHYGRPPKAYKYKYMSSSATLEFIKGNWCLVDLSRSDYNYNDGNTKYYFPEAMAKEYLRKNNIYITD